MSKPLCIQIAPGKWRIVIPYPDVPDNTPGVWQVTLQKSDEDDGSLEIVATFDTSPPITATA